MTKTIKLDHEDPKFLSNLRFERMRLTRGGFEFQMDQPNTEIGRAAINVRAEELKAIGQKSIILDARKVVDLWSRNIEQKPN